MLASIGDFLLDRESTANRTTSMDVREFLRLKLAERGMTMKQASERIGRNQAYLQQFLERGIPSALPEEARERLAEILAVPPDELRGAGGSARSGRRPAYLRLPP